MWGMAIVISLGFVILIVQAVRMTRQHLQRSERTEYMFALDQDNALIVELDPEKGGSSRVREDPAVMRATWHPIRFPEEWESRSRGLPAEKVDFDKSMRGRRDWCEAHCRGRWRVEGPNLPNPVFWFEDHQDAMDFSLAWFPFKCS